MEKQGDNPYGDEDALSDEELRELEASARGEQPAEEPSEPEEEPQEGAEDPEESKGEEEERGRDEAESRRVPLSELLKERDRRKRAEESINRFESMLQRLSEQQKQPEPQPEPVPDLDTQPFEYIKHQAQTVEELRRQQQEMAQRQQMEQIRQTFEANLAQHEAEFAKQNEDYYERVQYVGRNMVNQYRFRGYDENAAAQLASRDMKAMAYDLYQRGVSPAQYFHQMAEETFGYQRQQPAQHINGEAKETRQKGRKAFKSLSNADGAAPKGRKTVMDLANMDEEQFAEYMESNGLSSEDILRELKRGS